MLHTIQLSEEERRRLIHSLYHGVKELTVDLEGTLDDQCHIIGGEDEDVDSYNAFVRKNLNDIQAIINRVAELVA